MLWQGVQNRCFAHPQSFQGVQLHTLPTPFCSPWVIVYAVVVWVYLGGGDGKVSMS